MRLVSITLSIGGNIGILTNFEDLLGLLEKQENNILFLVNPNTNNENNIVPHGLSIHCTATRSVKVECWGIIVNSNWFIFPTNGFTSLEDHIKAYRSGFSSNNEYIKAKKFGFETKEMLLLAKNSEFKSKIEMDEANRLGYANGEVYRLALKNGFQSYQEYEIAKETKCINKIEYNLKQELDKIKNEFSLQSYDECILVYSARKGWIGLASLEKGVNLPHAVNEYKKKLGITNQCEWLTTGIFHINIIKMIFEKIYDGVTLGVENNENIKKAKYIFNENTAVLDCSNICWYGKSLENKEFPEPKNIEVMITHLSNLGCTNITPIADASLYHQVEDKDLFDNLVDKYNIVIAPSGTDADLKIIEEAKNKNCYIITNDTYKKDHVLIEDWVKEMAEYILVPYIILGNVAKLKKELQRIVV